MQLNVPLLRKIMKEKQLNQTKLAERLGVTRATISIWLKRPESLKLSQITDIANAVEENPRSIIGY